MTKKIAVIGLGSAGIQSICHLLTNLTNEYEIISIHEPNIDITGIGESTNPSFIVALQDALDFDLIADMDALDATYKFGTQYKKWRNHDFVNPLIDAGIAIHFNTYKLKEFALPRLRSKWSSKFKELHGTVTALSNAENCVHVTMNGNQYQFN